MQPSSVCHSSHQRSKVPPVNGDGVVRCEQTLRVHPHVTFAIAFFIDVCCLKMQTLSVNTITSLLAIIHKYGVEISQ